MYINSLGTESPQIVLFLFIRDTLIWLGQGFKGDRDSGNVWGLFAPKEYVASIATSDIAPASTVAIISNPKTKKVRVQKSGTRNHMGWMCWTGNYARNYREKRRRQWKILTDANIATFPRTKCSFSQKVNSPKSQKTTSLASLTVLHTNGN